MTEKTLKRAIMVSWIILIICFSISIFGGKLFNVAFQTKQVLDFEIYFENNIWLQIISATVTNYLILNLLYLTICEKRVFKWWIHLLLIPYFIGTATAKIYLYNVKLFQWGHPIDLITYFIIPAILLGRPFNSRYFRIIITYVLSFGFQAISAKTKNFTVDPVILTTALMEFIFIIDILIMSVLYYLHTRYKNLTKEEK